ncbi:P-loop containing nucleoside triphosphate hydrolase protein, partial [Mycena olivaceomarginata]
PQIFHGRDSEVAQIVRMLHQEYAKIAILGAGGMGKTSLARAVLHHPTITAKYGDHFFVSCESASTHIQIAAVIGAHLGLTAEKNLTKSVLLCLAQKPTCLLILDNLETTWEPLESRSGVENLISLLTDLPHLALIITMRGAECPARVHWTHPFLEPLGPLSHEAARQTFTEIAEDFHDPKDIDQLLQFTDNMPLAVDLMAHLVDYGGCARVLAQWEVEKTSMLSAGHDRRSNLDASIALSLSSPRLSSLPGAIDLLSLLSILPDGLSNVELVQSNLPIPDILACKTVLIGTALAYYDDKKRLKSLVPIREYMQHFCPVAQSIIQPLQSHFHKLLKMHQEYNGSYQITDIVSQITLNSGNIHNVLQRGLT